MNTKRALLTCLMILVLCSITMLSLSTEHFYLVPIGLTAVCLSLVLTDWLKWLSIDGWLANSISILILIFAMRNFFDTDSAGKLLAVAKLLVYLQAVLLFQQKTARLTWQIMVLSLLQIVVTTIFSVNVEGGLLFIVFFVVGCLALFLQNSMINMQIVDNSNEHSALRLSQINKENREGLRKLMWWKNSTQPITSYEAPPSQSRVTKSQFGVFPALALVATIFTTILFLTAPRHVKPWFSPITYKVVATGVTKSVDPYETGSIAQTGQRILRAKYSSETGSEVQLSGIPYYRGIALSSFEIEEGRTRFVAPYERIYNGHYEDFRDIDLNKGGRPVTVEITVEQNSDPVIYAVTPSFISRNTEKEVKFCHEISALTRCRQGEEIAFAPFSYEFATMLNQKNEPLMYWPYIANNGSRANAPMSEDPGQVKWLTAIQRDRYPTLVETAKRIADKVKRENKSRIDLVREMENHFLNPGNYQYTLDYRDVDWNRDLDPIEDFVVNTRTGHCVTFASAMTLMLRSLDIPSRLVVGFHGGEYNAVNKSYLIRGKHAHAWVEVYLPPEECSESMKQTVECESVGVWLTADPTPPQPQEDDGLGTDDAIDLARSVWQDYVLGMESKNNNGTNAPMTLSVARLLEAFSLDTLPTRIEKLTRKDAAGLLRPVIAVAFFLTLVAGIVRFLLRQKSDEEDTVRPVNRIRKLLANAIGLISSDLREWIIGDETGTAFYKRFAEVLNKHELVREPQQTHREFAQEVCDKFSVHPSADEISTRVHEITELFNRVRFGGVTLGNKGRDAVEAQIDFLEKQFSTAANR